MTFVGTAGCPCAASTPPGWAPSPPPPYTGGIGLFFGGRRSNRTHGATYGDRDVLAFVRLLLDGGSLGRGPPSVFTGRARSTTSPL
jgi:hypothetical protein